MAAVGQGIDSSTDRRQADGPRISAVEQWNLNADTTLLCVSGLLDSSTGDVPDRDEALPAQLVIEQGEKVEEVAPVALVSQPTGGPGSWSAVFVVGLPEISECSLRLRLQDGTMLVLPSPASASVLDRSMPSGRAERAKRALLFAAGGVAASVLLLSGYLGDRVSWRGAHTVSRAPAVHRPALPRPAVPRPSPPVALPLPANIRLVAQALGPRVAVYRDPSASQPELTLSNPTASKAPLVFLVERREPGRIQVALPTRPNGSSGWIDVRAVSLATDAYKLDVDLTRRQLTVSRAGSVVERDPIGVGLSLTPTPSGTYYVIELLRLTNPKGVYGPYAFGLSAHSTVLHEFAGGNGRIGLHGTDTPGGIGHNVSHGCIRLSNVTIIRLAKMIPLGTPVQIHR